MASADVPAHQMRNQLMAILENAQEQMLGLDGQAAQEDRLIPGEKQRAPGRLVIALKHTSRS